MADTKKNSPTLAEVASTLPTKEQVVDLLVAVLSDQAGTGKSAAAWLEAQRAVPDPEETAKAEAEANAARVEKAHKRANA